MVYLLHVKTEKKKKKVTDKVAGEAKVLNGGVLQLSSGWVVLMVLLSLTVRTQDLVAATEGGWC